MDNEKKVGAPQENEEEITVGYRVYSIIRSVIVYLLAAAIIVAALFFAADRSPQKSLFGYRYYTVLTPSMRPEFDTGDMVFVKLIGADSIQVGDVITFNPSSGSDAYLTHRVTQKFIDYEGTGVTCFRTKGDANDSEDSFLIDEERVIGVVQFHVPKLGVIVRFIQLKWYYVAALVVLLGIFLHLLRIYFSSGTADEDIEDRKDSDEAGGKNFIKDEAGTENNDEINTEKPETASK